MVNKPESYRAVFSESAAEFIVGLSKRRRLKTVSLARQLAGHPFLRSDYRVTDEAGREIEHLLIEDCVFAYWLDHAEREVRIVDIEDAT